MPDIEEFVQKANTNEQYPVNVNPSAFKSVQEWEKTANRDQFKSKHFGRAETVCCIATTITFIIIVAIYIYFQTKEAGVWMDKEDSRRALRRKTSNKS